MRYLPWIVLGSLIAGCQGQSTPAPVVGTANQATSAFNQPMPPELAVILEEAEYDVALAKINQKIQDRPAESVLYSVRSSIHHRFGKSQSAIDDLDKAISLNDQDARLYNNRGFVRMGKQLFTAALADLDRATELAPEYANPYNNRGLLLIARGQFASAIEQFDQALRLDHDYVDAYNNRGFAALQAGKIDRALADFNAAIQLNPKYVNAYNNRGLLRAKVGDLNNAIIDFTQAMIIDPTNPKYYEHRREVYMRQSAFDLASVDETRHDWLIRLQELDARVTDSPANTGLLVERARHYLSVEDETNAIKDLDRVLKLDPRCVPALVERGQCRVRQRDYRGALVDANCLMEISPCQEAYSLCGDAYLGLKEFDKAIDCFAKARRIDAAVADAYMGKSEILQAAGQQEQAANVLKQAVALNPGLFPGAATEDDAKVESPAASVDTAQVAEWMSRAQECQKNKDFAGALVEAKHILNVAPSEEAYSLCGDAYLGLKNYDNAIECFAKAKRIDPAVAEAYFGKSQIQKAAGHRSQAIESMKLALAFSLDVEAPGRAAAVEELMSDLPKVDAQQVADLLEHGRKCQVELDFAGALADATKLLKIAASEDAYSLCGDACLGLKDYDKAIECYAKARRIDGAVAEAYYRKSRAQKASGQQQEAAESLKLALALDPQVAKRLKD